MANPKQMKIIKMGVEAWNQWRDEKPNVKPRLIAANLSLQNLDKINLNKARLMSANFEDTILTNASFVEADLKKAILVIADLNKANLNRANLREADLSGADLSGAKLIEANLSEASLVRANLSGANLSGADLIGANFNGAYLSGADLSRADLSGANLIVADLREANLSEADLVRANLSGANLTEANLRVANLLRLDLVGGDLSKANLLKSDLRYSNLVRVNLSKATLTGAKLYGTSRDDWNIEGIKCDYVYWDEKGKIRSPKGRDFATDEFEQIYKSLPTIEYIFQNGMLPIDPLIMDRVVQSIRENKPEFDLKIDSINARGLAPSIKFTVQQEEHKELALQEIKNEYECRLARLETDKENLSRLLSQALENNRLDKLLLSQSIEKAGDTIITGNGSNVATRGSEIKIEQRYAIELKELIEKEPKESKSFLKIAKDKALYIVGGALEDMAKGKVKEAAKDIYELGKLVGPLIAQTAAYAYFKGII